MIRIEFGQDLFFPDKPPKWKCEWFITRDTLEEAIDIARLTGKEFKANKQSYNDIGLRLRIYRESNNALLHYITPTHPGIWTGK